jgi:hypothetical protein
VVNAFVVASIGMAIRCSEGFERTFRETSRPFWELGVSACLLTCVSDLTGTVRDSNWQRTFHYLLLGIYL